MKRMKLKLSFFINIITVLIVISFICVFLSKGEFKSFFNYFLTFVAVYTIILIIFLSIVFIVFNKNNANKRNDVNKTNKKNKCTGSESSNQQVRLKNKYYFDDNEVTRDGKKYDKEDILQDILDEDEALKK